jgi:hypothetical protein
MHHSFRFIISSIVHIFLHEYTVLKSYSPMLINHISQDDNWEIKVWQSLPSRTENGLGYITKWWFDSCNLCYFIKDLKAMQNSVKLYYLSSEVDSSTSILYRWTNLIRSPTFLFHPLSFLFCPSQKIRFL